MKNINKPNLFQYALVLAGGICLVTTVAVGEQADSSEVETVRLSANPDFSRAAIHLVGERVGREGIVVVAPGRQGAKRWVDNPEDWSAFANEHNLGLAILDVEIDRRGPSRGDAYQHASLGLGETLISELRRAYAGTLPFYLFGEGEGADFVATFVMWRPGQVAGWATHNPVLIDLPAASAQSPRGLVLGDEGRAAGYRLAWDFFARSRAREAPLVWMGLPDRSSGPESAAAPMARGFFAALREPGTREVWRDISTKAELGLRDAREEPDRAVVLPGEAFAKLWREYHVWRQDILTGDAEIHQATVETGIDRHPELRLYLRLPTGAESGGEVAGLMAFAALGAQTDQSLISRLRNPSYHLVRFADQHNLALLTWNNSDGLWDSSVSYDEMSRERARRFDQEFDQMARAWERGMRQFYRELDIPEDNYLLYGISRGAQWAHRLALRLPHRFLAVHVHVNSSYDRPVPEASNILWLVTTGELESGYPAAQRFYQRCLELGYPIIFKAGRNLGHSNRADISRLGTAFFEYALSQAREAGLMSSDGGDAFQQAFTRGQQTDPWTEVRSPAFIGDFLNHTAVPASQAGWIPPHQRVALPNEELARVWEIRP